MYDLTILETIKLKEAGISSHNFKLNVPSNIPTHNQVIHKQHLKTQIYINEINNWTEQNKILKNKFTNYEDALKYLNLDSLNDRRKKFSLRFAKNCIRNEKVRNMFPINLNKTKITRKPNKYKVNFAKTERYKKSSIPSLQRMLNQHELERELQLKI